MFLLWSQVMVSSTIRHCLLFLFAFIFHFFITAPFPSDRMEMKALSGIERSWLEASGQQDKREVGGEEKQKKNGESVRKGNGWWCYFRKSNLHIQSRTVEEMFFLSDWVPVQPKEMKLASYMCCCFPNCNFQTQFFIFLRLYNWNLLYITRKKKESMIWGSPCFILTRCHLCMSFPTLSLSLFFTAYSPSNPSKAIKSPKDIQL